MRELCIQNSHLNEFLIAEFDICVYVDAVRTRTYRVFAKYEFHVYIP